MSTSTIPLDRAQKLAEKICAEIWPFCDKVAVAGSIRRQRPFVGDIDLVVLPKAGHLVNLQQRFKRNALAITEGFQNAIYKLQNGVQLDVFFAWERADLFEGVKTNWGTLLLCRTGSKEHNIHLVSAAKALDLAWHPYNGVIELQEGKVIASATEEDIFRALKLDYLPPEQRER